MGLMAAGLGRSAAAALWLSVVLIPAPAGAAAACHCFTDRTHDPAQPAKSDPYLLATAQNSFLAAAFGLPKDDIVRARMSGTSGEDLWVGAYAGEKLGRDPALLRETRNAAGSWRQALETLGGRPERFDPPFGAALAAGANDAGLARAASCATLAATLGADQAGCIALGGSSATVQEGVLAQLLARLLDRPAAAVLGEVKAGRTSWSALLAGAGIEPGGMQEAIARLLGPSAPRKK